jgi:uncharacterized membrane protein YhaH (DUF805 family)
MLANPNWFRRRKYTGWGYTPNTWQGWLYVIAWVSTLLFFALITQWLGFSTRSQLISIVILLTIMIIDALDTARKMPKDERESIHEAYAERNACWVMIAALLIGLVYQLVVGLINHNNIAIDPFILIALLSGTIAKAITNWYLIDK